MQQTIIIESKYCGPPGIGNGGYVAGMLARYIDGPAEVTLRRPAPLDTELVVSSDAGNGLKMSQAEDIIVDARPAEFSLDIPEPPTLEEAVLASRSYPGFKAHPCPGCFVCGPERSDDGLQIYPGLVEGREIMATPWTPDKLLTDKDGKVRPEFIWAVLDCPGGVAAASGRDLIPILLGKMSLTKLVDPRAGEQYLVIAWLIATEGRKYFTGSALFTEAGELQAYAKSTWIRPKQADMF